MHKQAREAFNNSFTEKGYEEFVESLSSAFPGQLDFRVAETPVFVPKALKEKILRASDEIIGTLSSPDFLAKTDRAVPANQHVPGENTHSSFLAIDYAICRNEAGELVPQLIELQGFPSIFGYQALLSETFRKFFDVHPNFEYLFDTNSLDEYVSKLKALILGREHPDNVILI